MPHLEVLAVNDLLLLSEPFVDAEPLEAAFAARALAACGQSARVSRFHAAMAEQARPDTWQTAAWLWSAGEDLGLLEEEARARVLAAAHRLLPAMLSEGWDSTVANGALYGALRVLAPHLPELELARSLKELREAVIARGTWGGRLAARFDTDELDPMLLLLLPFGLFGPEDLLLVGTVEALERQGGLASPAVAWLAYYYQAKGTHPGRLAELRAMLQGDSLWEAAVRVLIAIADGQQALIRHIPTGYDHPYERYTPERIPRDPVAGERVEVRATTTGVAGPLTLEWRLDGLSQAAAAAVYFPPRSQDEGYWTASLGPLPGGARVEYRWVAANAATEWFGLDVLRPNGLRRAEGGARLPDGSVVLLCSDERGAVSAPVRLSVDSSGSLRVRFAPGRAANVPAETGVASWAVGPYQVIVQAEPFRLQVLHEGFVLADCPDGAWRWLEAADGSVVRVTRAVTLEPGERLYGTGERFDRLDRRGTKVLNTVYNQYKRQGDRTYIPVPFVLSSRGYGLWAATDCTGELDLGAEAEDRLCLTFQGSLLELVIIPGPALPEVISRFTELVGRPVLPPAWAFGPWMSSNNWDSQAEVDRQVRTTEEHDTPASVLVLEQWSDEATFYLFNDAQYGPRSGAQAFGYGDFHFPAWGRWPDPRAMVQGLKARGMRVLFWQIPVWKHMGGLKHEQRDRDEAWLIEQGYVVKNPDGSPYRLPEGWFSGSLLIDFTNPEAVAWWLEKRRYLLDDVGADGFKTDGGEFIWNRDVVLADGSRGYEARNRYANQYIGATYRFVQERTGGDGITFSRAGYTGAQAFPLHWAGDQASTWEEFRAVVIAGLNAGLAGISMWGWDLGGFSEEPPTAELFCRGAAMACFCPVMQYHTDQHRQDRTPWNLAERTGHPEVTRIYRYLAHLRYNLVPYIYSQAAAGARTGLPLMRPLFLIHPDDSAAAGITDQYYLGEDLLVAPVLEPGAAGRHVYLPAGGWYDFWTGESVSGGQTVWCEAPWDRIPVFVRAGSVIPLNLAESGRLGEGMRHGDAEGLRNLYLLVYPDTGPYEAVLEPAAGEQLSVRGEPGQLTLSGVRREVTVAVRPAAADLSGAARVPIDRDGELRIAAE